MLQDLQCLSKRQTVVFFDKNPGWVGFGSFRQGSEKQRPLLNEVDFFFCVQFQFFGELVTSGNTGRLKWHIRCRWVFRWNIDFGMLLFAYVSCLWLKLWNLWLMYLKHCIDCVFFFSSVLFQSQRCFGLSQPRCLPWWSLRQWSKWPSWTCWQACVLWVGGQWAHVTTCDS